MIPMLMNDIKEKNSAQLELMFGLVQLEYRFFFFFFWGGGGGQVPYFVFHIVWLWLDCIPKISFLACLEVPQKFVRVVVGGGWWWWLRVNLVIALAQLQPSLGQAEQYFIRQQLHTDIEQTHRNKTSQKTIGKPKTNPCLRIPSCQPCIQEKLLRSAPNQAFKN